MSEFIEDRSVLSRTATAPDTTVRYGAIEEQIADVRYGKGEPTSRPLVILIHGGFWRPQIDRTHTGPMAGAMADAGWTVAAIEYRRIPGEPQKTFTDVSLAMTMLPSLVAQHNGKAIVMGHSAGGHLTLWTAATCGQSALIGAIALGPAADLHYGYEHAIGSGAVYAFLGAPPAKLKDVDPCQMTSPSTATTIIHGAQDAVAPIVMAENYRARHPNTHLIRIDNCGHFAIIDPLSAPWSQVMAELQRLSTT
jgi:acetyl esterase/lipase